MLSVGFYSLLGWLLEFCGFGRHQLYAENQESTVWMQ